MARQRSPSLTDGEARLMTVLWERTSATVADIVETLGAERPVNYSTVQTLLRILEKKGYIEHRKSGRRRSAAGAAARAEAPGEPLVRRVTQSPRAQRARARADRARRVEAIEAVARSHELTSRM